MSVPKNKRTENKLQALKETLEMVKYTIQMCENEKIFPKKCRWNLCSRIIDNCLDIVAKVSQLIALMYLDEMDHIIKEQLRIKHYVRYMDDFILIDQSREKLREALTIIRAHLSSLGLSLNKKTMLQKLPHGISFLGWKFILTDTGKVVLKPDKRKLTTKRRKLKGIMRLRASGRLSDADVRQIKGSMISHLQQGNAVKAIEYINKA